MIGLKNGKEYRIGARYRMQKGLNLKTISKNQMEEKAMFKRGEIYYIENSKTYQSTGSEQKAERPGIIISNNTNNENSTVVQVVFLTTQPKTELPTHVQINSSARVSTALCEQIFTISVDRVTNYMGECTPEEMAKIEKAIKISLGIDSCKSEKEQELQALETENKALKSSIDRLSCSVKKTEIEKNVYQEINRDIIKLILRGE